MILNYWSEDDEIRLICYENLSEDGGILKLIEDFNNLHIQRPEVVMKYCMKILEDVMNLKEK